MNYKELHVSFRYTVELNFPKIVLEFVYFFFIYIYDDDIILINLIH